MKLLLLIVVLLIHEIYFKVMIFETKNYSYIYWYNINVIIIMFIHLAFCIFKIYY